MEDSSRSIKEALICFGDRKRPVQFSKSDDPDEELRSLLTAAKVAFKDLVEEIDTRKMNFQIRSEKWNGEYVDMLGTIIPNGSILRMSVGGLQTLECKKEVCNVSFHFKFLVTTLCFHYFLYAV